jgi:hypothetical protein
MRRGLIVTLVACMGAAVAAAGDAQTLLDRVAARVHGQVVMLSDVRAAVGLGLVPPEAGSQDASAARALIDRHLMLAEVRRFLPSEPDPIDVLKEVEALHTRAGSPAQLEALKRSTGLTDTQMEELAQDSLRLEAYLAQRFGTRLGPDAIEMWLRDLRRRVAVDCLLPGC